MSVINVKISLLNEEGTYFPGEEIHGNVDVDITHQVKISRITISIIGVGSVQYVSQDGAGLSSVLKKQEMYLEKADELYCEKVPGVDKFKEAGSHTFPFVFLLPKNIPSSFESEEGHVRYALSVHLEGFELPFHTTRMMISINALVNLNEIPKAQQSATAIMDRKQYCLCCVKQPNIHAVVQTPKRGYVPGEVITINAEVNNLDSQPVPCVKARLMQIITYHHRNWPKRSKRLVTEVTRGYILGHESQHWIEEALLIPPVVASYLEHCKLMDVKYKIYFRVAKANGTHTVLKLPIIIGTIPLKGFTDTYANDNESASDGSYKRAVLCREPCFFGPYDTKDEDNSDVKEESMFSPRLCCQCQMYKDAPTRAKRLRKPGLCCLPTAPEP